MRGGPGANADRTRCPTAAPTRIRGWRPPAGGADSECPEWAALRARRATLPLPHPPKGSHTRPAPAVAAGKRVCDSDSNRDGTVGPSLSAAMTVMTPGRRGRGTAFKFAA